MTQSKQTDLSKRLRDMAVFLEANKGFNMDSTYHVLLSQAADEIEQYYGGMLNWRASAESFSNLHSGRVRDLECVISDIKADYKELLKKGNIPDGWKLVPITPTPKMVDATFNDRPTGESHNKRNKRIYAAMIDAAPSP